MSKSYLRDVKRLPCEICVRHHGMDPDPWPEPNASDAHHPRTGVGAARKAGDEFAIALCKEHHQGNTGVHGLGRKAFEARYGITEAELSESTFRRVMDMRGAGLWAGSTTR